MNYKKEKRVKKYFQIYKKNKQPLVYFDNQLKVVSKTKKKIQLKNNFTTIYISTQNLLNIIFFNFNLLYMVGRF